MKIYHKENTIEINKQINRKEQNKIIQKYK